MPWTIKAAIVDDIYLTRLKEEVRTVPGFNWQGFVAASQYLTGTGKNLDLALEWAEGAIGRTFVGATNFATLTNKSQVLAKMGRAEESAKLFELALKHPSATATLGRFTWASRAPTLRPAITPKPSTTRGKRSRRRPIR